MGDKLTDTAIRNAKPKPKEFKLSDGGGLHLLIKPNGSKLWRFRYRYDGTESMLGLGAYNLSSAEHVPLSIAREQRDEARKLLKEGKNPSKVRKEPAQPNGSAGRQSGRTFESV